MNAPSRRIEWTVWAGLGLVLTTILLLYIQTRLSSRHRSQTSAPVYGTVAPFVLTNQEGSAVSLNDLSGHVWIADIIFTRCPGPCATMTRRMKELEQALPPTSDTRLVSLTTDPQFDTPPVLKTYAARFGANLNRWMFLTGTKTEIARLAIDSLKLAAIEKNPEERESPQDLFIHATIFVVVDKQGRLRGIFESVGEQVDPQKVKSDILDLVRQLEAER
jgi:protein SCO1/2